MRTKRASKLSHTSKPTYVERVLGAISLIQKGRKQRSVHLATLRAQVKKTAAVRKDRLGPQWSSHVGRAVQKLEAHGVLQHADTSGTVSLTPDAKRAVAVTRRELRISHPTPSDQEIIWKKVCADLTGSKRRRTDEGEEDPVHATPTKKSKYPNVKPRPISRMSKAELLAELRSLQRLQAASGSEELEQLRNDLKSRETEIERTRAQLEQVRDRTVDSSLESITPSLRVTPEPLSSSPPDAQQFRTRSHLSSPLSPTTPAPSEPDNDVDSTFSLDLDEDVFQGAPTRGMNGLFTPQTSPYVVVDKRSLTARPAETNHEPLRLEWSKLNASRDREVTMETDLELQLRTLTSYKAEIADLRKIIEGNRLPRTDLQVPNADIGPHADLDLRLSTEAYATQFNTLQAEIGAAELQIKELQSNLDHLSAELKIRESSITDLSAGKAMAEKESNALKEKENALRLQLQETSEKFRETQSNLDVISKLRVSLADQLRLSAEQRSSLASDVEQSRTTVVGLEERIMEKEERIQKLFSDYNALKTCFIQQETRVYDLQVVIGTEKEVASRLRTESVAERAHISTLQTQLDAKDRALGELESKYDAAEVKGAQAGQEIARLESIISELELTVDAMQMEIRQRAENVAQLTGELAKAKQNEVELCDRVSRLEITNGSLSSAIESRNGEVTELRSQLLSSQKVEQSSITLLSREREAKALSDAARDSKTSGMRLALDLANEEVADLKTRLASAEATCLESSKNITVLNGEIVSLRRLLEAETCRAAEATEAVAALDAKLKTEKEEHQTRTASLLSSLLRAQEEAGGLRAASFTAKHAYDNANRALESRVFLLQDTISTLTTRISDMQDASDQTQAQMTELKEHLNLAQGQALLLGTELEKSHAASDESQRKMVDLAKTVEVDKETIQQLVAGYARLKQAQMDCFTEMDSAVESATHRSTPTEGGLGEL